ncbi:hypothetical protein HK096_003612, partial [Nowakowskiella sp. JEL0078]
MEVTTPANTDIWTSPESINSISPSTPLYNIRSLTHNQFPETTILDFSKSLDRFLTTNEYENVISPITLSNSNLYLCYWNYCGVKFGNVKGLLAHISETHIGRSSTGYRCLKCGWLKCTYEAKKRDHIVQHMRRHLDEKEFICK